MDPNAALEAIREITSRDSFYALADDDARELVDLIDGLDIWLSRGGFRPDAWENTSDDYPANKG